MGLEAESAYFEAGEKCAPTVCEALQPFARRRKSIHATRSQAVKRTLDIGIALGLLIVGTPLCLLVGLAIWLEDGSPVLFRQIRVGRDGSLFTLLKLRSMRSDAEADGAPQWATPDDSRATRVGRWIRALRIDEIPQAWNVLVGDMSFVGPRPERPEFVDLLSDAIPEYTRRHHVRPGITGWAQVNQPYSGSVDDARRKLEYDLHYLTNWSLFLDLLIVGRTAKIILFGWGGRASVRQ